MSEPYGILMVFSHILITQNCNMIHLQHLLQNVWTWLNRNFFSYLQSLYLHHLHILWSLLNTWNHLKVFNSMHLWLVCADHWWNQVWVNKPWYVFFEGNALKELSIKPAAQTLFASHWRWAMPTSDCVIITRSPRDNEPNSNYAPGYHKSSSETTKSRYLVKTLGSDDQKLGCTCNSLNHKKI